VHITDAKRSMLQPGQHMEAVLTIAQPKSFRPLQPHGFDFFELLKYLSASVFNELL
jgi:hypothetical protein